MYLLFSHFIPCKVCLANWILHHAWYVQYSNPFIICQLLGISTGRKIQPAEIMCPINWPNLPESNIPSGPKQHWGQECVGPQSMHTLMVLYFLLFYVPQTFRTTDTPWIVQFQTDTIFEKVKRNWNNNVFYNTCAMW